MIQGLRFYQHKQLKTDVENAHCRTLFSNGHQALAEWRNAGAKAHGLLLAIDASHSVLYTRSQSRLVGRAYCPYGHGAFDGASNQGFNGERYETLIKAYALGQGYRFYSPNLMRFLAPDTASPFDRGGLNSYLYCSADPVNRQDPDGHADFSQMRRVPQKFLAEAARQRTARQRVEAFRRRHGINQPLQPPQAAQTQPRNPLALRHGAQFYERPNVTNNALAVPVRPPEATTDPRSPESTAARTPTALHEELMNIETHVQRYEHARPYLTAGTEVTDDYTARIERLRQRADLIRGELVSQLSWFHF